MGQLHVPLSRLPSAHSRVQPLSSTPLPPISSHSPAHPTLCAAPGPDGEPPAVPAEHYLGRLRAYLLAVGILRLGPFRSSGPGKSPAQEEHPLSSAIQNFLASDIGVPRRLGQIEERDRSDVPRFLNRLLGLAPVQQRQLFDMFQAALELHVREQGRAGTLDVGTQTLSATRVRLEPDPVQLFRVRGGVLVCRAQGGGGL